MTSKRVRRTQGTTSQSGLTSVPGKVIECLLLDTISINMDNMENKNVIREVSMGSAKGNHA